MRDSWLAEAPKLLPDYKAHFPLQHLDDESLNAGKLARPSRHKAALHWSDVQVKGASKSTARLHSVCMAQLCNILEAFHTMLQKAHLPMPSMMAVTVAKAFSLPARYV